MRECGTALRALQNQVGDLLIQEDERYPFLIPYPYAAPYLSHLMSFSSIFQTEIRLADAHLFDWFSLKFPDFFVHRLKMGLCCYKRGVRQKMSPTIISH